MTRKALGKGLSALFPEIEQGAIEEIDINDIRPNPYQPRRELGDIESLVTSIKKKGILQPLLVTKKDGHYELIAGERRYRAAIKAGLKKVPVRIIRIGPENEKLELALIENLQRADLNPIEEGLAYKILMERFNLTHEEIGERVGKERSTITNRLRLLTLPKEIQDDVSRETITEGHARAILSIPDRLLQLKIAEKIKQERLSVRETEKLVKKIITGKVKAKKITSTKAIHNEITEELKNILKTKVLITGTQNKGKISIFYFSKEEFERLIEIFYKL